MESIGRTGRPGVMDFDFVQNLQRCFVVGSVRIGATWVRGMEDFLQGEFVLFEFVGLGFARESFEMGMRKGVIGDFMALIKSDMLFQTKMSAINAVPLFIYHL